MKRCDCEHWEICPTCFPQGFDENGNRKPAERPPTRAELVEKIAALEAENKRAERIEELSFDAAIANQAREIGNHFGLTYMQVWSDTSIASQVIDKMKEQQAAIAQQAEQLAAAESRLHDVATHCATVEQQLAAAEKAMNRCYKMLLSEPDTKGALFKAENILREALADAVIAAIKEIEK